MPGLRTPVALPATLPQARPSARHCQAVFYENLAFFEELTAALAAASAGPMAAAVVVDWPELAASNSFPAKHAKSEKLEEPVAGRLAGPRQAGTRLADALLQSGIDVAAPQQHISIESLR